MKYFTVNRGKKRVKKAEEQPVKEEIEKKPENCQVKMEPENFYQTKEIDGESFIDEEKSEEQKDNGDPIEEKMEEKKRKVFRRSVPETKDRFFLIIENTEEVRKYTENIQFLIKHKILRPLANSTLLYVMQIGESPNEQKLVRPDEVQVDVLLQENPSNKEFKTLTQGIEQMYDLLIHELEIEDIEVDKIQLFYIGSMDFDLSERKMISERMSAMRKKYLAKTKCITIKDWQCVNAAYCGFQEMGHLEKKYCG